MIDEKALDCSFFFLFFFFFTNDILHHFNLLELPLGTATTPLHVHRTYWMDRKILLGTGKEEEEAILRLKKTSAIHSCNVAIDENMYRIYVMR